MASSFGGLFSRQRKVDDPTYACPLNKGIIEAELVHHHPADRMRERGGLAGAKASVTGGKSGKTQGNGKYKFDPVTPGNYTVNIDGTTEQEELYDFASILPGAAQAQAVGQQATVNYLFEVPGYWVEFVVQDNVPRPLSGVSWVLDHRPPNKVFKKLDTGVTGADGKIYRYPTKRGRYRLSVRALTAPTWSAARAFIGTEITLQADLDGEDPDVTGRIEILDAFELTTVLQTLSAKVKDGGATGRILVADWKPAAKSLANLKHSQIVFRGVYGTANIISDPLTLFQEEKVESKDTKGKNTDVNVTLHFSGGGQSTKTTVAGKADIEIPWPETISRISFPAELGILVEADGAGTKRSIIVPRAEDIV